MRRIKGQSITSPWLRILFLVLLLASGPEAMAGVKIPSWLQELSSKPLPSLPPETEAVYLINNRSLTCRPDGTMIRSGRQAIKVLRPDGIDKARRLVRANTFNTKVRQLKGWVLNSDGSTRSEDMKDVATTSLSPDTLYWDVKLVALLLSEVMKDSLVGFEWEEEIKPISLEDDFFFQDYWPVLEANYSLNCPAGFEPSLLWINSRPVEPVQTITGAEKKISLTIKDVPAIKDEPLMPPSQAVSGHLLVRIKPAASLKFGRAFSSWQDIGLWYEELSQERRQPDKTVEAKVQELTSGLDHGRQRLERLAEFVQKEIRYVSIQIGLGGYQPHPAPGILANRYGDCKDKATLLTAMLKSAGFDSFYIIINIDPYSVSPDAPVSLFLFNHVILAIKLADSSLFENSEAVINDPELGCLLIFDPTSPYTPLGRLPYYLSGSAGVLVAGGASKLCVLPVARSENNFHRRLGKFVLKADGTLLGQVTESFLGFPADKFRSRLMEADEKDRLRYVENLLNRTISGSFVEDCEFNNMDRLSEEVRLTYVFKSNSYLKKAGQLLSFKPGILALTEADEIFDQRGARQNPLLFPSPVSRQDEFDIELPEGYEADSCPPPFKLSTDFADYGCQLEPQPEQKLIKIKRWLNLKKTYLEAERFEEVRSFFEAIKANGRNGLLLKPVAAKEEK